MKNIKIFTLSIFFLLALVAPLPAFAAILSVDFENEPGPMFGEYNFMPGDSLSAGAVVTNHKNEVQNAYTELVGYIDAENLGSQLILTIERDGTEYFSGSFDEFFALSPVSLGALNPQTSTDLEYAVFFSEAAGNAFQGANMSFDVCIGFEGGQFTCADTDTNGAQNGGGTSEEVVNTNGLGNGNPFLLGAASVNQSGAVLGAVASVADFDADQCKRGYLTKYIGVNRNNDPDEVRKLQLFLRDLQGESSFVITGVYDEATQEAVIRFQERYADRVLRPWGLPIPTAFVYYTTRRTINEMYCNFTVEFPLTEEQETEIARFRELGVPYDSRTPERSEGTTSSEGGSESSSTLDGEGQTASLGEGGNTLWRSIIGFFQWLLPWW
jgi:hypothetical protein